MLLITSLSNVSSDVILIFNYLFIFNIYYTFII